jgi:hypothetical protein
MLGTQNPPTSDANVRDCGAICIPFIIIMVIAFVVLIGIIVLSVIRKQAMIKGKHIARYDIYI